MPVNQHCSARRLWQLIADRVDRAEWPLLGLNQQRAGLYSVSKGRARFDCLTSLTTPERDASSLIEHSIYGLYRISNRGWSDLTVWPPSPKNRNRHSAEYYWILQRRFHAREKMLIWVNRIIIYTREITTCKILVSKQNYSKCKIIHKT